MVGFAGATGRTVPIAATRIYEISFFTGFGVSSLVYWALNAAFPVPGKAVNFLETDESEYEGRGDADSLDERKQDEDIIECSMKEIESNEGSFYRAKA